MGLVGVEQGEDVTSGSTSGLTVLKRDGRALAFDDSRIRAALRKAYEEVHGAATPFHERALDAVLDRVVAEISVRFAGVVQIYEIQAVVEHELLESREYEVARAYIDYRVQRDFARSRSTDLNHSIVGLISKDSAVVNENANKDSDVFNTQRDLTAG
ncbi:MAG: nrdD, partial [Oerskovia sp.]|nr:nrdD [Oerskovia sp.]